MAHSPYFRCNLRNSSSRSSRPERARTPLAAKGNRTRKSRSEKGAKDQKLVIYGVKGACFRHDKLLSIRRGSWSRWQPCLAPQGKAKCGARAWSPFEIAKGAPLFLPERLQFWLRKWALKVLILKLEWSVRESTTSITLVLVRTINL